MINFILCVLTTVRRILYVYRSCCVPEFLNKSYYKNMKNKRIAIIGTVGVPACYGGYETLVENLLTYKQRTDIEYQVYCSSVVYKKKQKQYKGAKLIYIPFKANGMQSVIYDSLSLIHAYFTCDQILSLGTVGCFILPIFKLFPSKKFVVNLDGLDDNREKFNSFSQRMIGAARKIAAKFASVRVSDNQGIKDYVTKVYKRDSVLIEYGGDNAKKIFNDEKLLDKYNLIKGEYCFKVARIEPENNIEIILKAFSQMPNELLVLVGNWNRSEFGRTMRSEYSEFNNIRMLDPIYEPEEINLLRTNCKLYIHGHSAGGTNPSLVEAMNLGLCVIAYDVVYNKETTEYKTMYFKDVNTLKNIVNKLSADKNAIKTISTSMEEIALRRYLWHIICEKYENLFN